MHNIENEGVIRIKDKSLIIILGLFLFAGLIVAPADCLSGASRGLDLCFKIIIPSLFPFFVCSKLLIECGFAQVIGKWCSFFMRPIFNVPGCGSFAFVLGIISGYPVGAKCALELYEENNCTRAEAERLICFCNNSGPLFIIGSVAIGMLYSQLAGIILYVAHILSAISVGIVFRFYKLNEKMTLKCASFRISQRHTKKTIGEALSSAISQSVELTLYVCGFITFFSALLVILERFGIIEIFSYIFKIFGATPEVATALSYGFFEISNGIIRLSTLQIGSLKLVLISIILAWSGISVILQVTGIIAKSGLSRLIFVGAKALQAIFAGVYTLIILRLPLGSVEVFSKTLPRGTIAGAFAYSILLMLIGLATFLVISSLSYLMQKRHHSNFE